MTLAAVSAHATTSDTTLGNTRTITENFDGGSTLNGYFNTSFSTDDYLRLSNGLVGNQTSTLAFSTLASSNATVDFYYAFWSPNGTPATVSIDGQSWSLSPTSNILSIGLTNPGATSQLRSDYFSFSLNNLAAGQHNLSFSTGSGTLRTLKVDDIKITLSVPEPETYAMLLAGLGVLGAVAKRRKQG
ncbi:MAG: PEP-CTERM sorting domain-containing protein [Azonexaceae bacterium]|nr:PEP-CTERM sorting domain-containing protein [Azonexaceae bacterium]